MLSENGDVINRHDRAPDHSTVSIQNGGQKLPCGFFLDRNDFQSFDALASHTSTGLTPRLRSRCFSTLCIRL